jgi:hypothetical protein
MKSENAELGKEFSKTGTAQAHLMPPIKIYTFLIYLAQTYSLTQL